MIQSTTSETAAPDGTSLLTRHWQAEQPWAAMLIVHGLGEHSGRYEQTGSDFAGAGVDTSSYDQRGFGASGGDPAYVDEFADYLDDLEERLAELQGSGLPTVLLGHSLGGLIACSYALSDRPQPDYLVLSSPALAADVSGVKKAAAKVLSRAAPKVALQNDIKGEQLSTDPAVGRAYFADPLVYTKTTARLGAEIISTIDATNTSLPRLSLPTFVIHGGADTVVPPTASAPLGDLPGVERRLFVPMRHECFNEIGRDEVVDAVVMWIRNQVRPEPPEGQGDAAAAPVEPAGGSVPAATDEDAETDPS